MCEEQYYYQRLHSFMSFQFYLYSAKTNHLLYYLKALYIFRSKLCNVMLVVTVVTRQIVHQNQAYCVREWGRLLPAEPSFGAAHLHRRET